MNNFNREPKAEDFDQAAFFMNEIEQEELETSYSGCDVFANYSAGQMDLDQSRKHPYKGERNGRWSKGISNYEAAHLGGR